MRFFYLERREILFLGSFCSKKNKRKFFNFLAKIMGEPLWKIAICGAVNFFFTLNSFFFYLEHSETLFLGSFCLKKVKENFAFFDKNHELTPLKYCDFWPFEKLSFL